MFTLDVPLLTELNPDCTFVAALASGGMAVRSASTAELLLLDGDLRVTATVPLPGLSKDTVVSVSERAGQIAAHTKNALEMFDLGGRLVHRIEHGELDPAAPCAWSGDGTLLWTVVPDKDPDCGAVDVLALDTATWAVVGRRRLADDCRDYTAGFVVLADPVEPVAAVQAVLCNLDGVHTAYLRAVDGTLRWAFGTADDSDENLLLDVRPGGGEVLLADIGERSLGMVELRPVDGNRWLEWEDLADDEPEAPDGGDVSEGSWRATNSFFLTNDLAVTMTSGDEVLLFGRAPLRLLAQVILAGYDSDPFTGWDVYVPGTRSGRNSIGYFDVWGGGRIITSDNRIYDVAAAAQLAGLG